MRTWQAKNFQEYVEIIGLISKREKDTRKYPLWFRGHEISSYNLEPGIYRSFSKGDEDNIFNRGKNYGTLWLKEEYRYQHFVARNYDKVSTIPESQVEWQEVMQHYFSKTRLMDWSESAVVAAAFALEAYINPLQEDHEIQYKRRHNSPTVWILNPIKLNKKVYECFRMNTKLIKDGFRDFPDKVKNKAIRSIKNNKDCYFWLNDKTNGGINGLVSLSGLESLRKSFGVSLKDTICREGFNPFFYLLLRYYSDGLGVLPDDLPPLAIIHPHHSPRIHEQKGAFTIFPYYSESSDKKEQEYLKSHVSPFAMEYMKGCTDCLDKIVLLDPYNTAEELKEMGMRRSHLYPEMENITKDFENITY